MAGGIKEIKVPEKAYFTFEEIAERWGESLSTVEYYVWGVGHLRPAFSIYNYYERAKFRLYKRGADGYSLIPDAKVDEVNYFCSHGCEYEQEFLYINSAEKCFHDEDYEADAFEESCRFGRIPHLAILSTDENPYGQDGVFVVCFPFVDFDGNPITAKLFVDECDGKLYRSRVAAMQSNKFIITLEERDRFESEFGEQERKAVGKVQEDNTLRALGMMALLLAKQSPKFQIGESPNMEAIKNAVNDLADRCGISTSGLASLNKKLAEAMRVLNKEK